MNYTTLIKKFNNHFIALCLELNVSAQGETLVEAREELAKVIDLYKEFSDKKKIYSAPLDVETVREFLLAEDEQDKSIKVDNQFKFLETFVSTIPSYAHPMPA